MSVYVYDLPAIAPNHNNVSNLMHLHWWDNKLFRDYHNYIETKFTPYETLVLSAARRSKPMGLPTAQWLFPSFNKEQADWFINTFFQSSDFDALVTIRTLDSDENKWYNYNAIFKKPRFHEFWVGTDYRDVVLEFFDLRKL
jgi:hypothetical protein